MKKVLIIGAITAILVAILGVSGYAYAQAENPTNPICPFDGQCLGNNEHRGPGMMGNYWNGDLDVDGEYGPLHEYMINAQAKTFGLTPEELLAYHQDGKTLSELAAGQGLTVEEFRSAMIEARTTALEQAVADGVITQEQADWMIAQSSRMFGSGYGSGSCGMYGSGAGAQGGGSGMRGPRRNNQP